MGIERPTFAVVRLREGYDAEQVDLAVEMVLENLDLPQPRIDRKDIEGLRFTPVRRGGYDMTAVDDWFDGASTELDCRAGVHAQPGAPTAAPDVVVDLDARAPEVDNEWVQLLVKVAVVVVVAVLLYVSFT